jgi:hypothetical protein
MSITILLKFSGAHREKDHPPHALGHHFLGLEALIPFHIGVLFKGFDKSIGIGMLL